MKQLTILVVHNDPRWLTAVKDRPFLKKIDLNDLQVGHFQRNELCESRVYISSVLDDLNRRSEYLGMMSARYNDKYPLPFFSPPRATTRLEGLDLLPLTKNVIWAADVAELSLDGDWTHFAEAGFHRGHMGYVREMMEIAGYDLPQKMRSLWANNFICHTTVMAEFLVEWRRLFYHFYAKYGVDGFDFDVDGAGTHRDVRAAYFYERLTTLYFAHRTNLTIRQIP